MCRLQQSRGEPRGQGWKPARTGKNRTDLFKSIMIMDVDEVADGWYWSHRYEEGGGHGECLATGRRAVFDDRGLGVGPVTPETAC